MQRENERSCYKKSLSSPRLAACNVRPAGFGDLQRTRRFVMKQQTTCVEDSRVLAGRANSGMTGHFYHGNNAFTLIELLVVVLIIGILASVALPQYEKAVWKSRASNMQTFMRSVATAQNAYFLANGTAATELNELAVGFDGFTEGTVLGGRLPGAYNNLFEIQLSGSSTATYFVSGKYKGCGMWVDYKTDTWQCLEWHYYYKGAPGGFCQKIMKAGDLLSDENNVRVYAM